MFSSWHRAGSGAGWLCHQHSSHGMALCQPLQILMHPADVFTPGSEHQWCVPCPAGPGCSPSAAALSPSPLCAAWLCSSRAVSSALLCLSFPPPEADRTLVPPSLTHLPSVAAIPRLQHGRVLPSPGEKQVRGHGFRQLAAGGPAQPASVTALTLEEYLNTSVKALPICLRFQRNYSVYGKRESEREREHARERETAVPDRCLH